MCTEKAQGKCLAYPLELKNQGTLAHWVEPKD